jgi:hypothetical protein
MVVVGGARILGALADCPLPPWYRGTERTARSEESAAVEGERPLEAAVCRSDSGQINSVRSHSKKCEVRPPPGRC